MQGVIEYNTVVDTPAQSPYQTIKYAAGQSPYADTVLAGNPIAVTLPWYKSIRKTPVDVESISRASAGNVVGRWISTFYRHEMVFRRVENNRRLGVNPYTIMAMLIDAAARKRELTWYPDYAAYPAELVSVLGEKRVLERRYQSEQLFTFALNVIETGSATIQSTVPPFV